MRFVVEMMGGLLLTGSFAAYNVFFHYHLGLSTNRSQPIAEVAAPKDLRLEMFVALELRNQLGIVDQNGDLLRFSKGDDLDGARSSHSALFKQIKKCNYNVNVTLLEAVVEANVWIKKQGKPGLTYMHPFNGDDVAKSVERILKETRGTSSEACDLVQRLRHLQQKVSILRTLHKNACEFTGLPFFSYSRYVDSAIYRKIFTEELSREEIARLRAKNPLEKFYDEIDLEALDPQTVPQHGNRIYDRFKYAICVSKWKLARGEQTHDLFALIGLTPQCTENQYKAAKKRFALHLHPDKNLENPRESAILFKAYQAIIEKIKDARNFM